MIAEIANPLKLMIPVTPEATDILRELPPPPGSISLGFVRASIRRAEPHFVWCWDVIAMLRDAKAEHDGGERIVQFQRQLLQGLRPLEAAHFAIKREENRLIDRKESYKPNWFRRRMATLSDYTGVLQDAIAVGRALGDGFAWLFYEKSRGLVRQHLKHQQQPLLPTGIGGLGERFIVAGIPSLDNRFALYHGLTSFLRMGDVSLIDLPTFTVDAIGELKTRKTGDKRYHLTFGFLAPNPNKLPKLDQRYPVSSETAPALDPQVQLKLDKQLKRIGEAMSLADKGRADHSIGRPGKFYFDALAEAAAQARPGRFAFVRAGPGLVLGALPRSQDEGLAAHILDPRKISPRLFKGATDMVREFIVPGHPGNAVYVSSLGAGRDNLVLRDNELPFAWWPASNTLLRQILFGEVVVVAIYNPAHLLVALERKGFELTFGDSGDLTKAVRRASKRETEIHHLDSFHRFIGRCLVRQETVMTMIDAAIEKARSIDPDRRVKINLDPVITR
jgi:hypothetical protein